MVDRFSANPFSGLLDLNPPSANESTSLVVPIGFEASCDVGAAVGDPVIPSLTVDDLMDSLTTNVYDSRYVQGIIFEKPTPTTCIVITMGVLRNITTGLTRGQPIWISPTGGLTTTKPATGHLQIVGSALSSTDMIVNIENRKTIQA